MEMKQPHPIQYSQASDALTRIDRVYTSFPGWMRVNLQCRYMLLAGPLALNNGGISDHAPLVVEVFRTAPRAPSLQPLSAEIVNSERFKVVHDAIAEPSVLRSAWYFGRAARFWNSTGGSTRRRAQSTAFQRGP